MSDRHDTYESWIAPSKSSQIRPVWWIMATREITDVWIGWRVAIMLLLFSISLGITAFLMATNVELSLIPPKEMVFLVLQITLAVGLLMGLALGADSISGERERETLEGLLLTPASRKSIVCGKFIAAASPWPVILAISSAYMAVLSTNGINLLAVMVWGALLGSLLVVAFTALGMVVSTWSNSNKSSLSVGLFIYLIFLIPTQFPGTAKTGAVGKLLQRINPVEASNHFLSSILVHGKTFNEMSGWLLAPVLFAGVLLIILFTFTNAGLRLEIDKPFLSRRNPKGIITLLLALGMLFVPSAIKAVAVNKADPKLTITSGMVYNIVKTSDSFTFQTTVTNQSAQESSDLIVAINIVNIGEGEPADPEDWSPQRTQFISSLAPGASETQTWTIHAILEGDYMIYMAVMPEPDAPQITSNAVTGPGIHLTVTPFVRLNPGGILVIAVGMPAVLSLCFLGIQWKRRKQIDDGV